MSSSRGAAHGGVRLFVFDFDQTLSVFHVFKTLAGWTGGNGGKFSVPAPHASTELGQVHRIRELNESGIFAQAGGFAAAAFGGEDRLKQVRRLLEGLRHGNAEIIVCTKGLVGAVRKCLCDLGLDEYFDEVYGNIGSNYGSTPYDQQIAEAGHSNVEVENLLGRDEQANWGTKDNLIARLMQGRGLRKDQAVLVEDDPEEIRRAQPVCRTVFVQEQAGIREEHIGTLLNMVSAVPRPGNVAAQQASPQKLQGPPQGPLPPPFLQQLHSAGSHGNVDGRFPFFVQKADQKGLDDHTLAGIARSPPERPQRDTDKPTSPVSLRPTRSHSPIAQFSDLQQQLDWQQQQQKVEWQQQQQPQEILPRDCEQYPGDSPHRGRDRVGPEFPTPPPPPQRRSCDNERSSAASGQGGRNGASHANNRGSDRMVPSSPRASPMRPVREEPRFSQGDNRSAARASRHAQDVGLLASSSTGAASDVGLLASTSAGAYSAISTTPRGRASSQFRPSITDNRALSNLGWLPHEPEDGPLTPVCCWLQGGMPSDGRAAPPLCAVM